VKVANAPVSDPPRAPNAGETPSDFLNRCLKFGYDRTFCDYLFQHYPSLATGFPPPKPESPPAKVTNAPVACDGAFCTDKTWTGHPIPVQRKWDQLSDKRYEGTLTDIEGDHVCFNHDLKHCIPVAVTDANGHAVLDPNGNVVIDYDVDFEPMRKWIGYSVYSAVDSHDPTHLTNFWVADNGTLTKFMWDSKRANAPSNSAADSVTLHTDDGGHSLTVDVLVGSTYYTFLLDTGATDMSVTDEVADTVIAEGHAHYAGEKQVTLADGSTHNVKTITADTVTVGTHTISNVHVIVSPNGSPILLGLGVLNRIGRFTVDAPHRTLTFNGVLT
jgi:clan AA aspartic protease (TIGR02281 family)